MNSKVDKDSNQVIAFRELNRESNPNEVDLWNRFCKGDESAYVKIYETYFDILQNLGIQISHNIELVEDTIQDVFVDLRLKRQNLPEIKYSVKHYLVRMFRNKLLRYMDREKWLLNLHQSSARETFEFVPSSEHFMVVSQEYDERMKKLAKATKALTAREREVIYYFFEMNMSYTEVKDILKLKSEKSARNLFYRAVQHLKNLILIYTAITFIKIF